MRVSFSLLVFFLSLFLFEGLGCTSVGEMGSTPSRSPILISSADVSKTSADKGPEDPYEAIKRFAQVYELVRNNYVRETNSTELLDGALQGMLQSLDPHSNFLNEKDFQSMIETTEGEFFGIGIEISSENKLITVVTPIEDTPAYKAGLKPGDIILAIDDTPTQDLSLAEAVNKIKGPKGTPVELLILHKDSKKPEKITIVRDTIPLISVKSRFISDDGILWLRLTRFNSKTKQELEDALASMQKKAKITGMVLDLRNNPGGLLYSAVDVVNFFVKRGNVVSVKGRSDSFREEVYDVDENTYKISVPVVVLVNSGSASAAEIVAGALQDHKRAVIMGERTFGKGSVQNIIPLPGNKGIKLTLALYYTPNGRSIQAEGIEPDIEVPFEQSIAKDEDATNLFFLETREKNLRGHLNKNVNASADTSDTKKDKDKKTTSVVEKETSELLAKDNQLRMGLQMVRSLPKIGEISSENQPVSEKVKKILSE